MENRPIDKCDIVRIIAMIGVVADHYFQLTGCRALVRTGLCWGGVSVAIFFALSAYLFGEKWRASGNKGFEVWPFLKKRFLRIYIPLWVALIFVIALEGYVHNPFDTKTIVYNFLGLSWARPFTWAGHLWYITMIVILYFVFLGLSRIRLDKIPVGLWLLSFVGLSAIMMCLPNVFSSVSKVTIPHTAFFAAMVFSVGNKLMDFCNKHKMLIVIIAFGLFIGSWLLDLNGIYLSNKGIATVLNSICGFLFFYAMAAIIKTNGNTRIIGWLSGIRYELYLIHFSAIMFVRVLLPDCLSLLFYAASVIMIILSSYLLHMVSERINHILTYNHK